MSGSKKRGRSKRYLRWVTGSNESPSGEGSGWEVSLGCGDICGCVDDSEGISNIVDNGLGGTVLGGGSYKGGCVFATCCDERNQLGKYPKVVCALTS